MRIQGQAGVAELFGVSEEAINQWQRQGMPVAKRGGSNRPNEYEAADCIGWLIDREVGKVREESPRDRLYALQAEELAMRLAELRATMIPVADVEPAMRQATQAARVLCDAMLVELPPRLVGANAETIGRELAVAFDDYLTRLSRWRLPTDEAGDHNAGPS